MLRISIVSVVHVARSSVVMCGGGDCPSCIVDAMLSIRGERCILEVRDVCGGVLLCSFSIAFVEVTYVFIE